MASIRSGQQVMSARKRDQCELVATAEDYNVGLHIFALFLILACGTIACSFPVLVKAFPQLTISKHALFVSRHFGTGVLIALAFAHLLPTAFENLWDNCLPHFWTEGYDAMPGVIAMMSALVVMLVEMAFNMHGLRHSHSVEDVENRHGQVDTQGGGFEATQAKAFDARDITPAGCAAQASGSGETVTNEEEEVVQAQAEDTVTKQKEERMILQCLLLEAGILFHSVFIGLSISLSAGTTFIALMVAISFHQIFEGLALGVRIAAIPSLRISSIKPWMMSFAYGLTCPLGQAIGLGIRNTYDPQGATALLTVGIANAISAGMIMYAGLIQLLGEDLLSEESYRRLSAGSRIEAVLALILGCALMAMIAIWA